MKKSDMKNRILFLDQRIFLSENPRKGLCKSCYRSIEKKEIKQTQIHHFEYHKDNLLKDTIELCVRCHRRIHKIKKNRKCFACGSSHANNERWISNGIENEWLCDRCYSRHFSNTRAKRLAEESRTI